MICTHKMDGFASSPYSIIFLWKVETYIDIYFISFNLLNLVLSTQFIRPFQSIHMNASMACKRFLRRTEAAYVFDAALGGATAIGEARIRPSRSVNGALRR